MEWENDIEAQLRHIINIAKNELDNISRDTDLLGGENDKKVNTFAIDSIQACLERIKKAQ